MVKYPIGDDGFKHNPQSCVSDNVGHFCLHVLHSVLSLFYSLFWFVFFSIEFENEFVKTSCIKTMNFGASLSYIYKYSPFCTGLCWMCATYGLIPVTIFVLLDMHALIGTRGIFSWGWVGSARGSILKQSSNNLILLTTIQLVFTAISFCKLAVLRAESWLISSWSWYFWLVFNGVHTIHLALLMSVGNWHQSKESRLGFWQILVLPVTQSYIYSSWTHSSIIP